MKSTNHDCCSEIIQKVFLVLDGEMSGKEEKEFLQHLNECPNCLEMYSIEKSFKDFLAAKIQRKQISSTMITSIRTKIQATIQR